MRVGGNWEARGAGLAVGLCLVAEDRTEGAGVWINMSDLIRGRKGAAVTPTNSSQISKLCSSKSTCKNFTQWYKCKQELLQRTQICEKRK